LDNYDAADDGDRLRGDVRLSRPRRQESVHLLLVASRFTQEEYVRRWCSGGCLLLAKSSPNHTPFPPYSRWCAETETTFTCLPATLAVVLKRLYSLILKKKKTTTLKKKEFRRALRWWTSPTILYSLFRNVYTTCYEHRITQKQRRKKVALQTFKASYTNQAVLM